MRAVRALLGIVCVLLFLLTVRQMMDAGRHGPLHLVSITPVGTNEQLCCIDPSGRIGGFAINGASSRGFKDVRSQNWQPYSIRGMNDRSEAVGTSGLTTQTGVVFIDEHDVVHLLNHIPVQSLVMDINDAGKIVGAHTGWGNSGTKGFIASREKDFVYLEDLLGVQVYSCQGINNRGQVVGVLYDGRQQAFVWDRDSSLTILHPVGADSSAAYGINDHGTVVGAVTFNGMESAFVWNRQIGLHLIDDLLSRELRLWTVRKGIDINNRGQILAWADYDNQLTYCVIQLSPLPVKQHRRRPCVSRGGPASPDYAGAFFR